MRLEDIADYSTNPALDAEAIRRVENDLGFELPAPYKRIFGIADGFALDDGLTVYCSEDVVERNKTFEVQKYSPGFVAIGDDGGGRLVMLSVSSPETKVFVVDQGSLSPEYFEIVAESFDGWIAKGCPLDSEISRSQEFPDKVDVYLECVPPGGLKDLLFIKRELGIDKSVSELKALLESIPACIMKAVPYGKYGKRCQKVNLQSACLGLRSSDGKRIPF